MWLSRPSWFMAFMSFTWTGIWNTNANNGEPNGPRPDQSARPSTIAPKTFTMTEFVCREQLNLTGTPRCKSIGFGLDQTPGYFFSHTVGLMVTPMFLHWGLFTNFPQTNTPCQTKSPHLIWANQPKQLKSHQSCNDSSRKND